ncbi:MAG: hypothetical protein R6V54_14060 [Desulfobacteraceae bacterium]
MSKILLLWKNIGLALCLILGLPLAGTVLTNREIASYLVVRRRGISPLCSAPGNFVLLFAASALFWWVFEFLNRFVENWHYTGAGYPPVTYFLLATLSFSTVLPAVESLKAYCLTFDVFRNGFTYFGKIDLVQARPLAFVLLVVSCGVLFLLGVFPDQLFFGVWLAPLGILLACRMVFRQPHPFQAAGQGDWTTVAVYAAAALICGFFWELFNSCSHARWVYSVPYVHGTKLFEMPLLGYAGYLPFGLECALVIDLVKGMTNSD